MSMKLLTRQNKNINLQNVNTRENHTETVSLHCRNCSGFSVFIQSIGTNLRWQNNLCL